MMRMKIRNSRLILISLLLPLLVLVAGPALAEVVGRLSRVEGAVDIMPGGKLPAVAAKERAAVQRGDFVRTKSNARAEITFNDGSVVKVAQRSRIDVAEYSESSRKLALPRGKVQATVVPAAGGAGRSFEIRTPNAIAGVRGTSFYVFHEANVTGVAVVSGVVHTASVAAPSRGVTLVAGTATTVTRNNAPTAPRAVSEKELNSHKGDVTAKGGGEAAAPAGGGETSSAPTGTAGSGSSTTASSSGASASSQGSDSSETQAAGSGDSSSSTTGTASSGSGTTSAGSTSGEGTATAGTTGTTSNSTTTGATSTSRTTATTTTTMTTGTTVTTAPTGSLPTTTTTTSTATGTTSTTALRSSTTTLSTSTISSSFVSSSLAQLGSTVSNITSAPVTTSLSPVNINTTTVTSPTNVVVPVTETRDEIQQEVTPPPSTDTNSGGTDGGTTPTDGGTTPTDGGTTPTDGGTTPTDGGTTPTDGGTTPTDGGTTPTNGGSTPTDGTTTPTDGTTSGGTTAPTDGGTSGGTTAPTDGGSSTPTAAFSSTLRAALTSHDATIDPQSELLTTVTPTSNVFAPVISGATSLWSSDNVPVTLTGAYPALPLQHPNHYWYGRLFSESNSTHTTADGGAYFGYFGGMSLDDTGGANSGTLSTILSGIYIDPAGEAGIMQGSASGTFSSGTINGSGAIHLTPMNTSVGLQPSTFVADWWNPLTGSTVVEMRSQVITDSEFGSERNTAEGFLFDNGLNQTAELLDRGDRVQLSYLAADPSFGVWTRTSFGSYLGTGARAILVTGAEMGTVDANNIFNAEDYVAVTSIGAWQSGALSGKADGVWGDLATGSIKILTGNLTGSVNTGTATFGAVSNGSFMDLSRFLGNQGVALTLGYPTLLRPDSFTLAGTGSSGTVSLGTVNFYSRTAGDPLSLWVAPNITGTYSGNLRQTFTLMNGASPSTSSITGSMRISGLDTSTGTWLGTVNGIGETGTTFRSDFDGIAAGSFTGSTFSGAAAGLAHPVTYYSSINAVLKRYNSGLVTTYGTAEGVMGGLSLWGSTPELVSEFRGIGFLNATLPLTDTDYVMSATFRSQDLPTLTAMTADGGAYQGAIVGAVSTLGGGPATPGIMGLMDALSIDPDGNVGVLHGFFEGFIDPSSSLWTVDGEVYPVTLVPLSGLSAASLNSAGGVVTVNIPFGTGGTFFSGTTPGISVWAPETYASSFITAQPWFGIGQFPLFAPYFSPPTTNGPWAVSFTITDGSVANFRLTGGMSGYMWDSTSGRLGANTRASWHDMIAADSAATPTTGIFIGETVGTFNPTTLQAMTSGIWIETGRFLDLVATNPGALDKLNIPSVEVGRASFSGGNSDFSVMVNDLVFFAPVNGARPEIFATDSITGNYATSPPIGTATLTQIGGSSVAGFTPDFTIERWDTGDNKWSGSIRYNGTGGVVAGHGNVTFTGSAAGRTSGGSSGTFTGTAAGVVR